ncbi:MAG: sulfite exporter TauE/SafE family protein [Candidatus Binatia bacterium]
MPLTYLWLFPLGLAIGAFGTLIGAGGGFILVPILLILYPNENAELITSISLAVVFFNALSGSLAYARMKRVDFKSGVVFAVATIPGAILGAISVAYVPRRAFDLVFGLIMIAAAVFLWLSAKDDHVHGAVKAPPSDSGKNSGKPTVRDFVDADGVRYRYAYNQVVGVVLSIFVGLVSSLLGVGGGFIHVPALTRLLNFPVHIATATSHFVLAVMALTGTIVHIAQGAFEHGVRRTAILAVGVLIGAQIGARLSNRIGGKSIIRGLALALVFVGLRLVWSELRSH